MQLKDIIANMRNYADRLEASGGYPSPEDLRTFAGGIEQAVEELERSRGNVEAMRKALKRFESELSTMNPRGWADTLAYVRAALEAPPEPTSDAAKMREAILAIKEINDKRQHDAAGYEINDIIEEALVGNAEKKKEDANACE